MDCSGLGVFVPLPTLRSEARNATERPDLVDYYYQVRDMAPANLLMAMVGYLFCELTLSCCFLSHTVDRNIIEGYRSGFPAKPPGIMCRKSGIIGLFPFKESLCRSPGWPLKVSDDHWFPRGEMDQPVSIIRNWLSYVIGGEN